MFQGSITAIVTPFKKGKFDEIVFRNLVKMQIDAGINGIVPCGTTGESPTLDHSEHNHVVDITIDAANGKVPIIAGTGSNSTDEAIAMTKHAKDAGADASLQVCPYYNKPTQKGMYEHFAELAKIDLPLIVYNIQGRTGVNLETSTLIKLANEFSNIIGVKEASGNLSQMMDIVAGKPKEFVVLSGDDNLTLPLMSVGGRGVISVASNLIPEKMVMMTNLALEGELESAKKIHYELLPLFKILFIETNPIPLKAAMAMKGWICEEYRLPMCSMLPENKEKLKKVLSSIKVL